MWVPDWHPRSEAEIRHLWMRPAVPAIPAVSAVSAASAEAHSPETPLVSIVCATYGHGRQVIDALWGFLMQETTFAFEVLLHDDASPDDTADYCRAFAAAYPGLIRLHVQPENQLSRGGHVFDWALTEARGRYIARCEGDDFWTDPRLLARQVAVLESQPAAVFCGAGAARVVPPSTEPIDVHPGGRAGPGPSRLNARQVESSLWHLSTHVLTRDLAEAWHRFRHQARPVKLKDSDFLHFAFGQGELWQVSEVVSVYRDTGTGVWTALSEAARCRWHYESSRYLGRHLRGELGRRNRVHLAPRYLAYWARARAREQQDSQTHPSTGWIDLARRSMGAARLLLGELRTEPWSTVLRAFRYLGARRR